MGFLWLLGCLIVSSLSFTILEILVFSVLQKKVESIAGDWSRVTAPVDPIPIRFPVGRRVLNSQISRGGLAPLERACTALASRLNLAALGAGLLSVVSLYGLLLLISPNTSAAYWSLFFPSWNGFAQTGSRGVESDRVKFGETYAFLNQLFLGGYTLVSLVTAVGVQGLRLMRVVP